MILESDCQTVVAKFHTKGRDLTAMASFRGDARRWHSIVSARGGQD
jgi:hypothetical protein